MSDGTPYLKDLAIQAASGGLSGLVDVCTSLPLDLVKTRLQVQSTKPGHPDHYNGVVDCLLKTQRTEGLLALWKGFLPAVANRTSKMSVKFLAFEQYRILFVSGASMNHSTSSMLAGLCVGATEAILFNRFEIVKITMQTNKTRIDLAPSAWKVTTGIVREYGVGSRGLYKGVAAGLWSKMSFNTVFFGIYHSVKGHLPDVKDPVSRIACKFVLGMFSSMLACMGNIPFDVAKTRIQAPQPIPGQVKYRRTLPTMASIYKEEGWRALFKGLVPKLMRVIPGGPLMLLVNEYFLNVLHAHFAD